MAVKIILFITLLLYSIIASQSMAYIISLTDVLKNMNVAAYISFRKRTDKNFRAKFGKIVYATLIANILLIMLCYFTASVSLLILSIIAFVFLLADTWIAVKFNLPINNEVNEWDAANYPENWNWYRQKWLQAFYKRQVLNLSGFVSLVAGAIFY